jgi:hypothetical protein
MQLVSFITTETGDDLIVSFATPSSEDADDVDSLTLLRTPKFEVLLEDADRGVMVMPGDDDEDDLLAAVNFDKNAGVVTLTTQNGASYELDVRDVDPEELEDMCSVFRKMNFDRRIQLTGI